ncbi:hypothetical protein ACHAXM_001204 [Skeletonema potamos]
MPSIRFLLEAASDENGNDTLEETEANDQTQCNRRRDHHQVRKHTRL